MTLKNYADWCEAVTNEGGGAYRHSPLIDCMEFMKGVDKHTEWLLLTHRMVVDAIGLQDNRNTKLQVAN